MSGESLIALNTRLGGKTKPGKYDKARKFVLKIIPDLAYAAGLATRIRRLQIEEHGGEMPLELAILALCIREGLAKPEIAALRINLMERPMSRRALNELWEQINGFARASTPTETFGRTMLRVRRAYRKAQSQGLI